MHGDGKKTNIAIKFLAGLAAAAAVGKLAKDADADLKQAQVHRDRASKFQEKAMTGGSSKSRYLYDREASKTATFVDKTTPGGRAYKQAVMPDRTGVKRVYRFYKAKGGTALLTVVPAGKGNRGKNLELMAWTSGGLKLSDLEKSLTELTGLSEDTLKMEYKKFLAQKGGAVSKNKMSSKGIMKVSAAQIKRFKKLEQSGSGFFDDVVKTVKSAVSRIGKVIKVGVAGAKKISGFLVKIGIPQSDQAAFLAYLASQNQYAKSAKVLAAGAAALKQAGRGKDKAPMKKQGGRGIPQLADPNSNQEFSPSKPVGNELPNASSSAGPQFGGSGPTPDRSHGGWGSHSLGQFTPTSKASPEF